MSIVKRIDEYKSYKKLTVTRFVMPLSCGESVIRNAIKNDSSIGSKIIEEILNSYPELNPHWLTLGKGNMIINYKDHMISHGINPETQKLKDNIAELVNENFELKRQLGIKKSKAS